MMSHSSAAVSRLDEFVHPDPQTLGSGRPPGLISTGNFKNPIRFDRTCLDPKKLHSLRPKHHVLLPTYRSFTFVPPVAATRRGLCQAMYARAAPVSTRCFVVNFSQSQASMSPLAMASRAPSKVPTWDGIEWSWRAECGDVRWWNRGVE